MFDLLKERELLSEDQARFYIAEIVLALEHLHKVDTVLHCCYTILTSTSDSTIIYLIRIYSYILITCTDF